MNQVNHPQKHVLVLLVLKLLKHLNIDFNSRIPMLRNKQVTLKEVAIRTGVRIDQAIYSSGYPYPYS